MSSAGKTQKIDVEYVARLARLHLTEDEAKKFQGQLEHIVDYVEKIGELDVSGVEPTAHGIPVQNVFREDRARASLAEGGVLDNAPRHRDGHFEVPKIVE